MNRNFIHKLILTIAVILSVFQVNAKKANGTWQDYLSYFNAKKVAISQEKVYCVTDGGLFYFDLDDNSINKITSSDGLSDFGISTIVWNEDNQVLIVAYSNSNLDLIYDSEIINISDIKRKQITGDKTINNISFYGNDAYISCGFGIVVLSLDKMEVKDTYIIGEGGSSVCVNDVEFYNGTIYAATENGIYLADANSENLLDYENWQRTEDIPNYTGNFTFLATHAGALLASYKPEADNDPDVLYRFSDNSWNSYVYQINNVRDLQEFDNYLVVANYFQTIIVDSNGSVIGKIESYNLDGQQTESVVSLSAGIDKNGNIWIADYDYGLIRVVDNTFESVYPNGPTDNKIYSLTHTGTTLWVAPGNKSAWEKPHFQYFQNDVWNSFSKSDYPELDGFFNIIDIIADPADEQHIFVASWGGGLLEYQNNEFVKRYTNQNSILGTALPTSPLEPYVRIGGLAYDSEGNLWMTNSEVANNLVELTADGNWKSFELPEVASEYSIGQLIVTQNNDKWVVVPRGHDVYVVDKTGSTTKHLPVTAYFNNGTYEEFNRMNDVYSIAEDTEGDIWIGTSKGVAVFSNASRIWDAETFYATQPSLDLNNGLFNPLLETETVTSIAVDGANRKWLGTDGSGIYLVSAAGDEEILHFTSENSPLLSNSITSIAINQKSGEVFIGTSEGLISYQGDATEGNDVYENVYVYPNPVRETYDGDITITGLIENTDIKITDVSGNLVYHTTSLGGQAVWDGTNLNGRRVRTGVYLVFCNNSDGSQTHIAKLLFIH